MNPELIANAGIRNYSGFDETLFNKMVKLGWINSLGQPTYYFHDDRNGRPYLDTQRTR